MRSFDSDLPEVLVVQEVPREHLVNRDRPERAVVEVAQVLVLSLDRPPRLDVGDVVERAQGPGLERTGRPHAGERPPVEAGRRRDGDGRARRDRDNPLAIQERHELVELLLRDGHELPGWRMILLRLGPGRHGIAAVQARCDAAELLLRLAQLAHRDGQQPVGVERDPFVEPQLLLEAVAPQAERALAPRRQVLLEVLDVAGDCSGGLR